VSFQRIDHPHWEAVLKALVEEHVAETKSPLGRPPAERPGTAVLDHFWQVVPKEMLSRLPQAAHPRPKPSARSVVVFRTAGVPPAHDS